MDCRSHPACLTSAGDLNYREDTQCLIFCLKKKKPPKKPTSRVSLLPAIGFHLSDWQRTEEILSVPPREQASCILLAINGCKIVGIRNQTRNQIAHL